VALWYPTPRRFFPTGYWPGRTGGSGGPLVLPAHATLYGSGGLTGTLTAAGASLIAWLEGRAEGRSYCILYPLMITLLNLEAGTKEVLIDWLQSWFDGQPHVVPGTVEPVNFPLATITGGVSEPPQPLGGLAICVVLHGGRTSEVRTGDPTKPCEARHRLRLDFHVRAAASQTSGETREGLVQRGADLLYGILRHPSTRLPMAREGIAHLNPRLANEIPSSAYAHRLLPATAEVVFTVPD
jgi:hypothetical protein